jgi:hypothetical protein
MQKVTCKWYLIHLYELSGIVKFREAGMRSQSAYSSAGGNDTVLEEDSDDSWLHSNVNVFNVTELHI